MFPPVDDVVLQNNPDFAALYKTLTIVVLNPDGSTKNNAAAKERDAVQEELNKHRLQAAKHHLLIHALSTANPSTPTTKPAPALPRRTATTTSKPPPPRPQPTADLPPALVDLLLLLPPFLSPTNTNTTPLTPTQLTTLLSHPPFSLLPSLLPSLSPLLSSTLHTSATALARLANPATNPSFLHRAIPALPAHYTTLVASLATQKTLLADARLAAAAALTALLEDCAVAAAHLLRALEAKHGPIARSLEFRATETMLAAQKQAAEAEAAMWRVRRELYTPDVRRALMAYARHLRDARGRLGEGVRARREELVGYGGVDGEGEGGDAGRERKMKEMARVKREMEKQLEEVREDLERLGRA